MNSILDAYQATEEKEPGFNSVPTYGMFDDNGDYSIPDETLIYDVLMF